jgi:hypothetical protein
VVFSSIARYMKYLPKEEQEVKLALAYAPRYEDMRD